MMRSVALRPANAMLALCALALLSGNIGCSRPTNRADAMPISDSEADFARNTHPSAPAESPSGYMVQPTRESVGTISGRVLYS